MILAHSVFTAMVVALLAIAARPALAQTAGAALGTERPQIVVRAVRIAQPLVVDGRLDESWYQTVTPASGFAQQEPLDGAPTTEHTEAWIFFDADNIYVAVRCYDSQPSRMVLNEMRHDSSNLINNEEITVSFDTFHDRRNGYLFLVNALGGMLEESFVDERNNSRDWNTVWNARTARFDQGWTVEMVIPFKSLRYQSGVDQVWGMNISRVIRWKNERTFLSPVPRGGAGVFRMSAAATLVGIQAPPLGKNLEVKPYAIAKVTTDRLARPSVINDPTGDVGGDLKYGLTRGLTLDLTYNTDFAQVEEDVQQVNLTRFNLFFPEKREFFLEGQGIFNFAGQTATGTAGTATDTPILFFSRQIGLSSARPVPVVGGGRLTGRVGRHRIGIVNVQTDDEAVSGVRDTNFTALRISRDILRRSTIGALFTGRSRSTVADGSNEAFGLDANLAFFENVRFSAYAARTRTPGRRGNDLSYRAAFDYAGDRYGAQVEQLEVGENFNPEVGFLRRRNFRKSFSSLRFSPRPGADSMRAVRKFYYEGQFGYVTDTRGRLESRNLGAAQRVEFQNSDRINVEYARLYERLPAPFRIASGVTIPVGGYGFQQMTGSYQRGGQRAVAGTFTVVRGSFYGGTQTGVSYSGRVRATYQLAFEPAVSVNWIDLPQGSFVARVVSVPTTFTFSPRMFVAALPQYNSSTNTLSSNVRFRWEYQPGSELFVVYSDGRDTRGSGFPTLDTRGLVVKLTRLFRM